MNVAVTSLCLTWIALSIRKTTGILEACPSPVPQRVQVECANVFFHQRFRSVDGSCNNLGRPHWGKADGTLLRLLPPQYDDSANLPRGLMLKSGKHHVQMPNPREVSQVIMSAHGEETHDDARHSSMLAHWGQFLAHDMSLSKEPKLNCTQRGNDQDNCFNIKLPFSEQKLPKDGIFPFKRTLSCADSGVREQINAATSYIDASQVYGSSELAAVRIREKYPRDYGLIRENRIYRSPSGKGYLQFDISGEMACFRNQSKRDSMECFLAGDIRANEQLMLTSLHTVLMREHNRIAKELHRMNDWNGEVVYQETRKILGAIMQKITYHEWLPKILGDVGMSMIGPYQGYNPVVNAGIANAVTSAAMRFGHTMVMSELARLDSSFEKSPFLDKMKLRDAFFTPQTLILKGGIDPLIRGAVASPVKEISPDSLVNEELTNHLFPSFHSFPLDLAAMNIQRSRDHALPLYNEWRSLCGLHRLFTWDQLKTEARDSQIVDTVARLYGEPDALDLWVGGMLEKPVKGGKLGRTFTCLLADQFKRLRQGDRFWYENPGVFGLRQVESLRSHSLAKLLCNNMDESNWMPKDAFLYYPAKLRQFVRCDQIPDLNLTLWKIEEDGFAGAFACSSSDCTCKYQIGRWGECSPGSDGFVQHRYDLLVTGVFPPCTAQRDVARPCGRATPRPAARFPRVRDVRRDGERRGRFRHRRKHNQPLRFP